MKSRQNHLTEIARLKQARAKTRSRYLKRDYGKAIRRKQRELAEYDYYQRQERQHV